MKRWRIAGWLVALDVACAVAAAWLFTGCASIDRAAHWCDAERHSVYTRLQRPRCEVTDEEMRDLSPGFTRWARAKQRDRSRARRICDGKNGQRGSALCESVARRGLGAARIEVPTWQE